ncbi:WxL domain-containing protein [Weissella muntiaci]|uniref:WxL domain-containing protein n=1 Tax=Weissella muntiaci TaxID=2508881 RepID=A0A6C2C931_9LACO|nr:WxL domain-containing protein [Weissella muntiaci]TYC50531.1 WxL domain-containing protein [Weissella muntiaci]
MFSKKMTVFASAIALSTVAVTPAVLADTLTSTGDVSFTAPTDVVPPVNPGDGDTGTGSAGDLVISTIPNLEYGTHEISGKNETYDLTRDNQLQVADRRGASATTGKAQGWTVSVKASDFSNGTNTLPGASINFNKGTVAALAGETGNAPTVVANSVDSTKGATPVFAAAVDQGLGQWGAKFSTSDVQLAVPTQVAGNFKSTLTWSIANTPNA